MERTNRRTDGYGGDAVARTKFAAEIVAAVRAVVSPEFPVILRYSQWKQEAYDARLAETPQALEAILAPLVAAGVDAFHASTRRYWLPEFDGSDLNLAGWTKKLTGKPAITVGSVGLDGDFLHAFRGRGPSSATSTTCSIAWSATNSTSSPSAARCCRIRSGRRRCSTAASTS